MNETLNAILTSLPFIGVGWLAKQRNWTGPLEEQANQGGMRGFAANYALGNFLAFLILIAIVGTLLMLAMGASLTGVVFGVAGGVLISRTEMKT